eukprot:12702311-Ditylum_brightwellii.AAC.1
MNEYNIDIFGLMETNIPWTPKNQFTARKIGRKMLKNVIMEMSLSNEPAINNYQPGGTLVGVRRKHMGRIIQASNGQHGLGRWSYVCLTGE